MRFQSTEFVLRGVSQGDGQTPTGYYLLSIIKTYKASAERRTDGPLGPLTAVKVGRVGNRDYFSFDHCVTLIPNTTYEPAVGGSAHPKRK